MQAAPQSCFPSTSPDWLLPMAHPQFIPPASRLLPISPPPPFCCTPFNIVSPMKPTQFFHRILVTTAPPAALTPLQHLCLHQPILLGIKLPRVIYRRTCNYCGNFAVKYPSAVSDIAPSLAGCPPPPIIWRIDTLIVDCALVAPTFFIATGDVTVTHKRTGSWHSPYRWGTFSSVLRKDKCRVIQEKQHCLSH